MQKETERLQKLLKEAVKKGEETGGRNQVLINELEQGIKDLMKQAEEDEKRYKKERENSKVEQENLKELIREMSKAKKEAETRHQEEMNQMKQERKRAEERHQEGMNQMKQDKEDFKKELMEGQKELIQELMRRFQENQEKKTNKERSESRSINHDIHESQASNLVAESSDELNTGPSSGVLNKLCQTEKKVIN
ncbi:hypothetical protein [Wolbachia endosymbiont (group A) of Epistrophe grossularia]|uniref:hypothetical protein n=1 Tax=Wolbachia endosymbiont (group A) of Epistrophe grossularia TaxID=2954008 RepID=UPI00223112D5|nr:hypothetical protein [Wolbachia endosymbiont (group A) of Epistrophe grossularia]